jgi:EAL domain-containing protein (putative c-di-GMP-specific phosphodiesterase class I)
MIDDGVLLRRLESLIVQTQDLKNSPVSCNHRNDIDYALRCVGRLADAILSGQRVFGAEAWHRIDGEISSEPQFQTPAEMLLRLKSPSGDALPPYPAIMALYNHNLAPLLDTVLCLAALREFRATGHKQVSINISSQSLRDPDFIRTVLTQLERAKIMAPEKIIFEIHEGTANLTMNQIVLNMFRKSGVGFAVDDVGLSMQDVFRLSEFQGIADYIKIDRNSVCSGAQNRQTLNQVLSLVSSTLPDAKIIAEGVKDVAHAIDLQRQFPNIHFVQGLYLPRRQEFKMQWARLSKKPLIDPGHAVSDRFSMAASRNTSS